MLSCAMRQVVCQLTGSTHFYRECGSPTYFSLVPDHDYRKRWVVCCCCCFFVVVVFFWGGGGGGGGGGYYSIVRAFHQNLAFSLFFADSKGFSSKFGIFLFR